MYLTKPTGCTFQIIAIIFLLLGIGMISKGGGIIFFGIIFILLGAWMFWRGRRTPERKKES